MPTLDLSSYEPGAGTDLDAVQIANGFAQIQTVVNALDENNFVAGTFPRIIRGRVQSDGSILNGGGFTVNHSATGTYIITFTTAFSQVPAVTCLPDGGSSPFIAMGGAESASGVSIFITNPAGTLTDRAFYFIVVDTA